MSHPDPLQRPPDGNGKLNLTSTPPRIEGRVNGMVANEGPAPTVEAPPTPSAVYRWLEAPLFSLGFLTVLPAGLVGRAPEADDFGRSDSFFPLVGLALGALLATVDLLFRLYVPSAVLDVLLVALLAVLTGALHLDGVVDTFDGLFGGPDREQRLAIMRDPRAGSYGVVAVALVIALKIAALVSLPVGARSVALVLAPCLGRWGIVLVTHTFPYARPEGMGRAFKDSIRLQHVIVAGAIASIAAGLLGGSAGMIVWIAVCVAVLVAGQLMTSRLGGLTGDSYGAICEVTEAGVLVAFGLRLGEMLG